MPPIYKLPDELLLHITDYLRARDSAQELQHLRELCLVSKKVLPIAQEQLYAGAILPISCGCHPKVSAAVQFLRTLLDRTDLAPKVKALRFSIVRRPIGDLYRSQNFDIGALRAKCLNKLSSYHPSHPWVAAIKHDLESAYGGVLLSILPNVEKLDYVVKDHHRGFPSVEPTSALFGTSAVPDATMKALTNVQHFLAADLSFLRDAAFTNLRIMDLKRVDIASLLRLNGPNTLRGATQLEDLSLGVSIQFFDEEYLRDMQVCLGDVFAALGCKKLARLDITLANDTYSLGAPRNYRVNHFMSQLGLVASTLRILEIDLDPHEDGEEWAFSLGQIVKPIESLDKFSKLQRLKLPQDFLFVRNESGISPGSLPRTIQRLDIVAPNYEIYGWVDDFCKPGMNESLPEFRTLCLQCRSGLNTEIEFSENVPDIWSELEKIGIDSYVCDIVDGKETRLTTLYLRHLLMSRDDDEDEDCSDYEIDDDDSDENDEDEVELLVDGVD